MEFATQGAICDFCRQRDYLPFTCNRCHSILCLSHRTREQHECPSILEDEAATRLLPSPIVLPPKPKCHHRGCKIRELQTNYCRNCGHNHCLKHRFPTSHACEAFGKGIGRNTILPVGLIPSRPLDSNHSTDSSTEPIATSCQPKTTLPSSSGQVEPVIATESLSPSSTLINANSLAQSCGAEMAAANNNNGQQQSAASTTTQPQPVLTETDSSASSSSTPARRHNTNVAHLSKLLRQRA